MHSNICVEIGVSIQIAGTNAGELLQGQRVLYLC